MTSAEYYEQLGKLREDYVSGKIDWESYFNSCYALFSKHLEEALGKKNDSKTTDGSPSSSASS